MSTEQRPSTPIATGAIGLPGNASEPGRRTPQDCMSCGSHLARPWSTSDGTAWLCRECATLHGIGCP